MDTPAGDILIPPSRGGWRRVVPWLSGVFLLAGLVAVVIHFGELEEFLLLARQARPSWLFVALAFQAGTYVATAAVWQLGMRRAGLNIGLLGLIPLSLAKLFTDQIFPTGGLSGNAVIVKGLIRRTIPAPVVFAALLGGLLGYNAAYLALVLVSIGLLWLHHQVHPALVLATIPFVVMAVGAPLGLLWLKHRHGRPLPHSLERIPGVRSLSGLIAGAPADILRDPVLLAGAFLLEAMVFLLDIATLWAILMALGIPARFLTAFPAFMVASMIATIGPIPLGLGTFEATAVGLLRVLGIPLEAALTAVLLLRGFTFWLPMGPGGILAQREIRQR